MAISTISTKGQITLPAGLRKRLGMKPHDRVLIEASEDAIVIKRTVDFFALEGFLGMALPEGEERKRMQNAISKRVRAVKE